MFEHSKSVVDEILAERIRQQSSENWTPEHDDDHANGQIAVAAGLYALWGGRNGEVNYSLFDFGPKGEFRRPTPRNWPWARPSWKGSWQPSDPRRDLVKAGALILAEIERLDRKGVNDAS